VAAIAANRELVETFYGATLGLQQGRVAPAGEDRPLEFLAPDGSALHVYVRPEERQGRTGHGGIYRGSCGGSARLRRSSTGPAGCPPWGRR